SVRARELVGEEDVVDALHDAKRIGEVRRARNAGLIALRFRVARRPLRSVLLPLRERFRKVRDLAADHYAAPGRDRADCPEPPELGQRLRGMTFEIPVRRAEGLPDPVEIRAAFDELDRKSTRLNSSHVKISYAVFCLKKKTIAQSD